MLLARALIADLEVRPGATVLWEIDGNKENGRKELWEINGNLPFFELVYKNQCLLLTCLQLCTKTYRKPLFNHKSGNLAIQKNRENYKTHIAKYK